MKDFAGWQILVCSYVGVLYENIDYDFLFANPSVLAYLKRLSCIVCMILFTQPLHSGMIWHKVNF